MNSIPVAREILKEASHSVKPETDIYDAMNRLRAGKHSAIGVVDTQENLVGILTEKDCLRVLTHDAYDNLGGLASGTVRDYMSPIKVTLVPDMDLFTISAKFLETNFTRLPVVEEGKLRGWISRQSMLTSILDFERKCSKTAEAERTARRIVDHPESMQDIRTLAANESRGVVSSVLSHRHQKTKP